LAELKQHGRVLAAGYFGGVGSFGRVGWVHWIGDESGRNGFRAGPTEYQVSIPLDFMDPSAGTSSADLPADDS
jgi:hypothetical protein